MAATRKISVRLTEKQYAVLEALVERGEYTSVSEAIRAAIKKFIDEYKEIAEMVTKFDSYK